MLLAKGLARRPGLEHPDVSIFLVRRILALFGVNCAIHGYRPVIVGSFLASLSLSVATAWCNMRARVTFASGRRKR